MTDDEQARQTRAVSAHELGISTAHHLEVRQAESGNWCVFDRSAWPWRLVRKYPDAPGLTAAGVVSRFLEENNERSCNGNRG